MSAIQVNSRVKFTCPPHLKHAADYGHSDGKLGRVIDIEARPFWLKDETKNAVARVVMDESQDVIVAYLNELEIAQ